MIPTAVKQFVGRPDIARIALGWGAYVLVLLAHPCSRPLWPSPADRRPRGDHRCDPGVRVRRGEAGRSPRPPFGRPLRIARTHPVHRADRGDSHLGRHARTGRPRHHRPGFGDGRRDDHPEPRDRSRTAARRSPPPRHGAQPHGNLGLRGDARGARRARVRPPGSHRPRRLVHPRPGDPDRDPDPRDLRILPLPADGGAGGRFHRGRRTPAATDGGRGRCAAHGHPRDSPRTAPRSWCASPCSW